MISRNYRLKEFLSKCVLLEHLRLNFHDNIFSWPGQEQYETRDVLDWLSEPEDTAGLSLPPPDSPLRPRPVQFPHLKQLDIGMVVAESKTLVSLIDKYQQSLRGFSFHKVSLVETEKDKSRDKPNLWAGFFRQLQKLNLFLYTISITEMHQMSHEGRSPTVSFKGKGFLFFFLLLNMKIMLNKNEIRTFPMERSGLGTTQKVVSEILQLSCKSIYLSRSLEPRLMMMTVVLVILMILMAS